MTAATLAARAFLLLSGPFAGDYVATLAAAWPRAPRPILGRSRCSRCGEPIPPGRAIPLVSFARLRGRRPCCNGRIPVVYPVGEAAGLAVGAAAAFVAPGLAAALWGWAVGMALIYVGLVDLRRFSIPMWGLAALALAAAASLVAEPRMEDRLARLATGAVLALVFELLRRLMGRGGRAGVGDGDVMLAGVLGVLVNWRLAAPMIAAAALAPLAIQLARRRIGPTPLGFWLSISTGVFLMLAALDLSPPYQA
jgi:leader peptidase (prepilin peptidase)/N-methyltransferase